MARILPLDDVYYGTKVEFEAGDTMNGPHIIEVWADDHFAKPFASEREIAKGWTPERGHDHVESVLSYEIANIICEALTKAGY